MKHILLGLAFCGSFSTACAMQQDVKAVKEKEITEITIFEHVPTAGEQGYAKSIRTIIVPLTPDASPEIFSTPKNTPADSQTNSVQPTPATSPRMLITFVEQSQVIAALTKPQPLHVRSNSAPEVVGAAAAACAHAEDKPSKPKKLVTFSGENAVFTIPTRLRIETEFSAPEVVGALAAYKPSDDPKNIN